MAEFIELLVLAAALLLGDSIARPLGGFVYFFFTAVLSAVPKFGRFYKAMINGYVKLTALIKVPAWAISSSGVLLGLGVHYLFWGEPDRTIEFWVILIVTSVSILDMLHRVILYDITSFDEIREFMKQNPVWTKPLEMQAPDYEEQIEGLKARLARSNFVDLNLTRFLQLVTSFGVLYYSLVHLGFIAIKTGSSIPTFWQTIGIAFSPLNILQNVDIPFEGWLWNILSTLSAFFVFYWIVVFVALASSTVDLAKEQSKPTVKSTEELFAKGFEEYLRKQTPVKIVAALINPLGQEIGKEYVLLLNTSKQDIDITGWSLTDNNGGRAGFEDGILTAGGVIRFTPGETVRFSNRGGTITLLNADNQVVDSVRYSENDAREEGRTIVF